MGMMTSEALCARLEALLELSDAIAGHLARRLGSA